jgi:hypothetical protein
MSQDDKRAFKALKKIESVPVEGKFIMKMAMEFMEAEVKRLVGGRSCSLQR